MLKRVKIPMSRTLRGLASAGGKGPGLGEPGTSAAVASTTTSTATTAPRVVVPSSAYVRKARLMDYWQQSDHALETEFEFGRAVLMVNKQPLVELPDPEKKRHSMRLVTFKIKELRQRLEPYDLLIGLENSALLDAELDENLPSSILKGSAVPREDDYDALFGCSLKTELPPEESGISAKRVLRDLGDALGGNFVALRYAMLVMRDEHQRNLLAKFQALTRWYKMYKNCPTCRTPLMVRKSKSAASCLRCERDFYPTVSPVAICLVHDESNERCLLVRHKGSADSVFTCVAGFATSGESLQETARREVAEEVGIEAHNMRALNMSQSWPMPQSSLMCAFTAVADKDEPLDVAKDELEYAAWFSREEVREALRRTQADPMLRSIRLVGSDPEVRQQFRYVPPEGAIAHHIIKQWAERRL